jgi:hypothetical protein
MEIAGERFHLIMKDSTEKVVAAIFQIGFKSSPEPSRKD